MTQEGFEAWEVMTRIGNQLKFLPNGRVSGFDLMLAATLANAFGYDKQAILLLLGYAEAGLLETIKKQDNYEQNRTD